MVDHALLDTYQAVAGDPERMTTADLKRIQADWTTVDELLLDLHMIKHGYTTEGYEKHVERRLKAVCADESVVERLRNLKL